jgi:hypothetical protein
MNWPKVELIGTYLPLKIKTDFHNIHDSLKVMFKRWVSLTNKNNLLIDPRRARKTSFLKDNFKDFQYVTLDDLDYLSFCKF